MTANPHAVFRALAILLALLTCAEAIQTVQPGESVGPLHGGGEPRQISLNIEGLEQLALVAQGYEWGQACWGEPILVDAAGNRKNLTELKAATQAVGWGELSYHKGPDGQPLKSGSRTFSHGIFAHANSIVSYKVDKKYTRLETWVGLNHTAGTNGSVSFSVVDYHSLKGRLDLGIGAAKTDEEVALEKSMVAMLDAPLLFAKRHSYEGIHIYDTFYKWPGGGGGGLYILENPSAPRSDWKVRALIDETTPGTLGTGVYTHPDISLDAGKVIFCYKNSADACTAIYEINIDGTGLHQITDPSGLAGNYHGVKSGIHDLSPTYLPDGRIVFLSTRPRGLVPCANEGVSILHVMNGDGSDIHPISVNSETEFDPMILPDGRIIFGRWEYIDKTALTVQSLWTVNPDGTNETALFGNNMTFPEAILDPRPVPGSRLIAATLAKHNAPPRGSVVMIDPVIGKNDPKAIFNFEHPDNPTYDMGESCEPYPLSEDLMLYSGRLPGESRNSILMINRAGKRIKLLSDTNICLHAPMLVKPRTARVMPTLADRTKTRGAFYVQDVYQGLNGIKRGEAKWLRVVEEASRVSSSPGGNPYNQTFPISAALAFSPKIYHGIIPISDDGSIYFDAPSGRILFFQVLDKDKRLIQSMRTFIQAAPGVTRACIGCHEPKSNAPEAVIFTKTDALNNEQSVLKPESWGTGYMDYPSMIQPIWDKHCISCHGGKSDFAGRLDLTGGWTEHFNISYENLVDRRETQLVPYLIDGIDCMNGTALYSVPLFKPRSFGSATAPLAKVIASGHQGWIKGMTDVERDLVMAWIDSNGLYYGTWDYTPVTSVRSWPDTSNRLSAVMKKANCTACHAPPMTSDWFNLQTPEFSRILRAPMAKGGSSNGLAICRNHKADPLRTRIKMMRTGGYEHAVLPLERFAKVTVPSIQPGGTEHITFADPNDLNYQEMLAIIKAGRESALQNPRIDMPGAEASIIAGQCRMLIPPAVPNAAPALIASPGKDRALLLRWDRTAYTIGLVAEIHRGATADFKPTENTRLCSTELGHFIDKTPQPAQPWYALVITRPGKEPSSPSYINVRYDNSK